MNTAPTYNRSGRALISAPKLPEIRLVEPVEHGSKSLDLGSLPVLATANDAREFVRLLRRKPFGISIVEAMSAEPKRIFEQRKIAAYEFWGLVERVDDRLHLSELGREFATCIAPEAEVFAAILRSQPLYLDALQHFAERDAKVITRTEVVAYWRREHQALWLDERDDRDMEATIVTFFSLCHAADLGTSTVGKRGQMARLRLDRGRMRAFVDGRSPSLPPIGSPVEVPAELSRNEGAALQQINIYISAPVSSLALAGQLREFLVLSGQGEIPEPNTAIRRMQSVRAEEMDRLRQFTAALMLYDESDLEIVAGQQRLRPGALVELNILRAITNDRVKTVWTGGEIIPADILMPTPSFLSGSELNWAQGLDTVRSLISIARTT